MFKKLFLLLLFTPVLGAFAETIKTDVLVVGGTPSGVAAAIQSSRSKIKTLLIEQGSWLGGEMTAGGMCVLDANKTLPSGIWGEFRKKVRDFYKRTPGFDTTANAALRFEPYTGAAILKKMCDTVKNLTVKMNMPVTAVKKDGNGWELIVTLNGKPATVKAKVLVDATPLGDIAAQSGATFWTGFDNKKETGEALAPEQALPIIEDVTWVAVLKEFEKNTIYLMQKPAGYDEALYVSLKGKDIKKMLEAGRLPNNKYMIKWTENTYGATIDQLSPEKREEFYKSMRQRTLGLVFYIQNELGFKNIGIDDKEFGSPDHLPYIPYIREYRRYKGQTRMTLGEIYNPYANKLYRTSIAVGDAAFGQHYADPAAPKTNYPPLPAYTIPLGSIVSKDVVNLIVTEKAMSTTHLTNASTFYPSVQMTVGQAAGATAAYCVFFDKTTKSFDALTVRTIQGEILDYKGILYPFADIGPSDKYFRSVEQVIGSGMLKQVHQLQGKSMQVLFKPDSTVSTADVEPVLRETFTRAFIWFSKNHPGALFTVSDMLSYISDYTLTEPKTLQLTLQKQWQDTYKFKQAFDLKRPITRYEFAVLANKYLNPFSTHVDITGKVVN
ncbi:FAD-dependent oxidoreductase [Mucilaginibacter mali]|uniref:FAD-dependent oxidoreductase n=1 Tax=Mucilaginibacter mali TaxID=2740462 RepID=A0A7D4QN33_9SPHI|nr:FAD-dependent oxidoreductase [Mucilaginibacter mali]QKJ32270.1 FAD-dependent oxidoreductase [Mucilaginibacter mali]